MRKGYQSELESKLLAHCLHMAANSPLPTAGQTADGCKATLPLCTEACPQACWQPA